MSSIKTRDGDEDKIVRPVLPQVFTPVNATREAAARPHRDSRILANTQRPLPIKCLLTGRTVICTIENATFSPTMISMPKIKFPGLRCLMKPLLLCFALLIPLDLPADDNVARAVANGQDDLVPDPLTVRALGQLEKKIDCQFKIPFPAHFDIDAYRKRPIALIPINGAKVCVTRPIINPYDEPHTVEWMIGPGNPEKLLDQGFDCSFELDGHGEFSGVNLIVDWASDGKSTHQLLRDETESGPDFFERARLTYRSRAAKAKDPAMAGLLLAAFEKISTTIQALRKEEARLTPSAGSK